MLTNLRSLDPGALLRATISVKQGLEESPEWHEIQPLREDLPLQLLLLQEAYEGQIYLEAAARILAGQKRRSALALARKWRPALVRLYDELANRHVLLVWGTARNSCVTPEITAFFTCLATLNATRRNGFPHYVLLTGGSETGAMGAAIAAFREANARLRVDVPVVNVLLGFTEGDDQTETANGYGRNSPPLYSFVLRLYYMSLLGRPVARLAVDGGAGSNDEIVTEDAEVQMAKRTITGHSHRVDPLPPMVFVPMSLPDGGHFYDGLERQYANASNRGTMLAAELSPHYYLPLMSDAMRAEFGPTWEAKHQHGLWTPQRAAARVIEICDGSYMRMRDVAPPVTPIVVHS